jgi:c-di-GMP-related signal transduction protein
MNVCLARQPIFDAKLKVIGYELLYRSNENSTVFDSDDPDQASSQMVMMGLDNDMKKLAENRLAFVNFTEKLLLSGIITILPKNHLVVEILEDVRPNSDILKACRNLKKQGYILSLDDYVYDENNKAFLEYADIVKIDFLDRDLNDIKKDVHLITSNYKVKLLAEKVETREVFEQAKEMGFVYFQGYFFSKPELFGKKKLTALRINQLQLIRHAMDPLVDYRKLAAIIKNDAVLSYRILRLVNSAYYGLQYTVKNIRHALAILGIVNIRKYVTLLTLEQMTDEKPEELIRISLIRGRFLESLAPFVGVRKYQEDLFLMGLFSLIDVLSDTPMNEVIEKTNLPEKVAIPLLTGKGTYADLLNIIVNYERGNWDEATAIADQYGLSSQELFKLFIDSVEWASELLQK